MLSHCLYSSLLLLLLFVVISPIVCHDIDQCSPLHKVKSIKKSQKYKHIDIQLVHLFNSRQREIEFACMPSLGFFLSECLSVRLHLYIDEGHQILLLYSFKLISSSPSFLFFFFLMLIEQKEQVNSWRNKVRDIVVVQSIIDNKTFGI
jgi:hypothetical protein